MYVNREEAVLRFLEAGYSVESRRLSKFPIQSVRPAVVFAREDFGVPCVFRDYRESPVPTDVVETIQRAILVHTQYESISGLFEAYEISRLREPQFVRNKQPLLGEYGSTLQLIHLISPIP